MGEGVECGSSGRRGDRFCGRLVCVGSERLCGATATLCLERGYIGSTIASAPIIGIYGFTELWSALRAESRIHGDTELWIYGKTEYDAGGKTARIGPGKKMRFGNEVPEGFVAVDFVDFLHDSANFKQAWFALAALEVL